jgi:hypothetical protein
MSNDLWASLAEGLMAQLHGRARQLCKHMIQHNTRTPDLKHNAGERPPSARERRTTRAGKLAGYRVAKSDQLTPHAR